MFPQDVVWMGRGLGGRGRERDGAQESLQSSWERSEEATLAVGKDRQGRWRPTAETAVPTTR